MDKNRISDCIQELKVLKDSDGQNLERVTHTAFSILFEPYLKLVRSDEKIADGNRTDMLYRIEIEPIDGEADTMEGGRFIKQFWYNLVYLFKTMHLVVECKNLNREVAENEIYVVEKYLYPKALRTVCFYVSRRGYSRKAIQTCQSAFRDTGKLILPFTTQELIEMLAGYENGEQPIAFLKDKMDKFLYEVGR